MICEKCGKEFFEDWRKDKRTRNTPCRFCSLNCCKSFSASINNKGLKKSNCIICGKEMLVNKQVSVKNIICKDCKNKATNGKPEYFNNYSLGRKCIFCGIIIKNYNKTGYCQKCLQKSEKSKENLRQKQLEKVKNGTHIGWHTRNILSYPEEFFKKVLTENKIKYIMEKPNFPINKKELGAASNGFYFLDFYFPEIKLDLEIDGKQHSYKERIESDKTRDELLKKNGITVYRIKWKNPVNEKNKLYIKDEIDNLLKLLN